MVRDIEVIKPYIKLTEFWLDKVELEKPLSVEERKLLIDTIVVFNLSNPGQQANLEEIRKILLEGKRPILRDGLTDFA